MPMMVKESMKSTRNINGGSQIGFPLWSVSQPFRFLSPNSHPRAHTYRHTRLSLTQWLSLSSLSLLSPSPAQLMKMINENSGRNLVEWSHDGMSFAFCKNKEVIEANDFLKTYFISAKYTSLRRKLNRWGFRSKVITFGGNVRCNAYAHPVRIFQNGRTRNIWFSLIF